MVKRATNQQKPRVFIGSSSEVKEVVEEFVKALSSVAYPIPWWRSPEFKPMKSILSGLLEAVDRGVSAYDFGLFILAADDVLISRRKKSSTTRDNVIFELGLFLGAFGPDRTFAVIQKDAKASYKLNPPSDFGGIIIPPFSTSNKTETKRTVREAASRFRKLIEDKKRRPLREKLSDLQELHWEFLWKEKVFRLDMTKEFLRRNEYALKGKELLLISMVRDDSINREKNKNIAFSVPRDIPQLPQDMTIVAPDKTAKKNIFSNISEGAEVEGLLLALPASLKIKRGMVIEDFLDAGAEVAFGGSDYVRPNS